MDARVYLDTRTPPAPPALGAWLSRAALDGVAPLDGLRDAGLEVLAKARGAPGRVRESAFQLLGADALITYACEAALDEVHPGAVLNDLLERAARAS